MIESYVRDHLRNLRQELIEWIPEKVRQMMANLLISTTIDRASEGAGTSDPLIHSAKLWGTQDGATSSNADTGEIARPEARAMEHPGFACVPRDGDPCLLVGMGANLVMFPLAHARWRPAGLKQSEAAIYNLAAAADQGVIKVDKDGAITLTRNGATVKIDKDGKITIDSKAGQDIVLNGGVLKLARVTDDVRANVNFQAWCAAINTALVNIIAILNGMPGAPVAPGNPDPIIGDIDGPGAERVKG